MSSSDQQFVRVNLPSNAVPGSRLNISTDNGKAFEIVVPEGAHPGDTITVQIPHDLTTNDTTTYINAKGEVEHSSNRKALGAAAVATVAGALVIGPMTGLALGAAAVYATTRNDGIGEAARSAGAMAATGYDKASKYAEENGLYDKMRDAKDKTVAKMTEINDEYHVTDKAMSMAGSMMSAGSSMIATGVSMGLSQMAKGNSEQKK